MYLQPITTYLKHYLSLLLLNLHTILFLLGLIVIALAGFIINTIVGLVVSGAFLILIALLLDKGGDK
ncbi:hypothetical protein [Heyndrickxia ginsengihumi]|uniref:hypothetical protein n=1 Tax=Heyndrickxia ginsengihumi TaxID=363870 RepID=UPI00047119C7|nr:hypothetical protein [Heyndrickxia ginsengihumi]